MCIMNLFYSEPNHGERRGVYPYLPPLPSSAALATPPSPASVAPCDRTSARAQEEILKAGGKRGAGQTTGGTPGGVKRGPKKAIYLSTTRGVATLCQLSKDPHTGPLQWKPNASHMRVCQWKWQSFHKASKILPFHV